MQGEASAGSRQIRQGLDAYQGSGGVMDRPYFLALLAESECLAGEVEAGLAALREALDTLQGGRGFFYEAELYRLQGALLSELTDDRRAAAESHGQRALDIARQQGARSLELRAAISLAHWQRQHGKADEARALLEPIYGGLTEGFDASDARAAQALLAELEA